MAAGPTGVAAAFTVHDGRVVAFDERVGAGRVTDDATGEEWSFHCTSIADGSRTIDPAAVVRFEVRPGPNGLEAVAIRPRP
jgi:cold shock CspA family protein